MAETAAEYKERLLRTLSGDAFISEKAAAFIRNNEIPYAETDAISEAMEEQAEIFDTKATFLRSLALIIEDVDI